MLLAASTVSLLLLMLLGSSAKLQLSSDAIEDNKILESRLDNPNYFERDLDISQSIIDAYYEQQSGKDVGQCTIAAIRERNVLWPGGIVYYTFHSSVDSTTQAIILGTIDEIENKTCLRFHKHVSDDHIEFTGEGDGCSSTSVGKSKGKQLIRLPASSDSSCRNHGLVLHLICHALGMWHEQSRPDRDLYIEILEENMDPDNSRHFNRRREKEVKNYGQLYDYSSIMHLGKDYFSNNGKDTLRVANTIEYECQGEPVLGQHSFLSVSDAIKLNQMYNCPGSGYGVQVILKCTSDMVLHSV